MGRRRTCIRCGGQSANRFRTDVFEIVAAWPCPHTLGTHVVDSLGVCVDELLCCSCWAGAWEENTLCMAVGQQRKKVGTQGRNKLWVHFAYHEKTNEISRSFFFSTYTKTRLTVVCAGLISWKCSATSFLLLNWARHSGHLLFMYCTSSAFLLGAAWCDWGVGFGVTGPTEDNDGFEEDDRRDGESTPGESRRNIQKGSHTWITH